MYPYYQYDRTLHNNKRLSLIDDERVRRNRSELLMFSLFLVNLLLPMKAYASIPNSDEPKVINVNMDDDERMAKLERESLKANQEKYRMPGFFHPYQDWLRPRNIYYIRWVIEDQILTGMDLKSQNILNYEADKVMNNAYLRDEINTIFINLARDPWIDKNCLTKDIRWFEGDLNTHVYARRSGQSTIEIVGISDGLGKERVEKILIERYK